jgi:hypothetical protein
MTEGEHLELWLWAGRDHAMATLVIARDGENGKAGRLVERVMIPANDNTAVLNPGKAPPSSVKRSLRSSLKKMKPNEFNVNLGVVSLKWKKSEGAEE